MIKKKKTMYEILGVLPNATHGEIQDAYQQLSQNLHSERSGQNNEEIDYKLRLLNVAFHTLSTPVSREAYDAQLASLNAPVDATSASNSVVAIQPTVEAVSLRADAMLLRAESMSLRADALSLRADAAPPRIEADHKSFVSLTISSVASPLKKLLVILGTMTAIGMVLQVAFLLLANRQADHPSSDLSKAEEKVIIQQYYQENGVRPGSRTEADLLEIENRRRENEQRAEEREQKRIDDEYRRFVEDSRLQGERVTADLRRAEERERYEEEQNKLRQEEDKRRQEEAEQDRIERLRESWRRN